MHKHTSMDSTHTRTAKLKSSHESTFLFCVAEFHKEDNRGDHLLNLFTSDES